MKRFAMTLVILIIGAALFCVRHHSMLNLRRQAEETRLDWMNQTQWLAQARIQLSEAEERHRFLIQSQESRRSTTNTRAADSLASLINTHHLSADQAEELLADLEYNWNTTGEYLIVTKNTLRAMPLQGMQGMKLTDIIGGVLAITPEEHARLDLLTQTLGESYGTWAAARLKRDEPNGDVVVGYTLPEDASFSQSFSNQFTSGILSVLGKERGELLQSYSDSWLASLGMSGGGDTSFVVKRYQAGNQTRLNYAVRSHGNAFATDVSPEQPFPEAFLPIFPNGWTDLAKREGFDLPKGFNRVGN